MNAAYLSCFQLPSDVQAPLAFEGERQGDELLNGRILAGGQVAGRVENGVAVFGEAQTHWSAGKIEKLRRERTIARSWKRETGKFCEELAAIDGVILEIAAGPGGGNLPPVLHRNRRARMIVNDVSPGVLQLWRELLAEIGEGPNVCFAAFDACEPFLRAGSIAAVSGPGALGNIEHPGKALREVRRALQPRGILFVADSFLTPDDWPRMPAECREWLEQIPGMAGWAGLVEQAGLAVEFRTVVPGRPLDPENDGLAVRAAEFGAILNVDYEYIKARRSATLLRAGTQSRTPRSAGRKRPPE